MRCLTLASALARQSANVAFVCRELPDKLHRLVEQSGFAVHLMRPFDAPEPADHELTDARRSQAVLAREKITVDWLVVDHYGLGAAWETRMRPLTKQLLVIDDLANRQHRCDMLVDDNLVRQFQKRYDTLVSKSCIKLLGPNFLLVRSDFENNATAAQTRGKDIKDILITMGGSDSLNMTSWILGSLLSCDLPKPLEITVVAGPSFAHFEEVERMAQSSREHCVSVVQNVTDMAKLMRRTDLAISAGGQTCYELILSAVPTLVLAANTSQHEIMQELHRLGAIAYLGLFSPVLDQSFCLAFTELLHDSAKRRRMIETGSQLIDSRGPERVSEQMLGKLDHANRSDD